MALFSYGSASRIQRAFCSMAPLSRAERPDCGLEHRAATGLVAIVSYRNSANRMLRASFHYYACSMAGQRTTALIAQPGNWNAVDCEPGRAHTGH